MGSNDQSWGWDLGRNKLYHDNKNQAGITYPAILKSDENFTVPDSFYGKPIRNALENSLQIPLTRYSGPPTTNTENCRCSVF